MALTPPAASASIEDKLQFLINSAVTSQTQFQEMRSLLVANQSRIELTESKVTDLEAEVKKLKVAVNTAEQQTRTLSVRILGLSPVEDEVNGPDPHLATAKLVYDRILRPILSHAKTNGKISTIPSLVNTITKAFRTSKLTSTSSSPPIIINLASSAIKTVIFSSKRDAMPQPSPADRSNGAKKLTLSEDLTPDTFAVLKCLRDDKRVSRAWTVDGHIRFIRSGDSNNTIVKVKSVYDSVDSILSK
jgi:hypothetical protein